MDDKQLRERLQELAERRLLHRPGAAHRFREYVASSEGAAAWGRLRGRIVLRSMLEMFEGVEGPGTYDAQLLNFIDQWAAAFATLDDVEPLPPSGASASPVLAGRRLPDAPQTNAPDAGSAGSPTLFKRVALLTRNADRWPSIEADLREASRNGLASAARDSARRGWNEGKALAWAESRGKLRRDAVVALPSVLHRVSK